MFAFIPRSLCALKRVVAKSEHNQFGATQGIRITVAQGLYRAEACDGRRAVVAQGMVENDAPWPGFKDTPNDAFEVVIPPKDLERACKVAEASLGAILAGRHASVGLATVGADVMLGLGNDVVSTRTLEGRFPNVMAAVPKTRPMFSVRVDPKQLAETLLTMADLLTEDAKGVQVFFYGNDKPIGLCARNLDTGMMIDGLVVPLLTEAQAQEKGDGKTKDNGPANGKDKPEVPAAGTAETKAPAGPVDNPQPAPNPSPEPTAKANKSRKTKM